MLCYFWCDFNAPHLLSKVTDEPGVLIACSVQLYIRVLFNVYLTVMQIFLPAKKEEGKLFFLPWLLVKPNKQILSRIQTAPWLHCSLKATECISKIFMATQELCKNSVPSTALINCPKYFLPIEEIKTP